MSPHQPFGKKIGDGPRLDQPAPMTGEEAVAEVQEKGEISTEVIHALLDVQGKRGIYENSERLEELRSALINNIKQRILIREFPVPDEIEPIVGFHR